MARYVLRFSLTLQYILTMFLIVIIKGMLVSKLCALHMHKYDNSAFSWASQPAGHVGENNRFLFPKVPQAPIAKLVLVDMQQGKYDKESLVPSGFILLLATWVLLRGCLPKILIPIFDHITDFLETLHVSYTF